MLKCGKLIAGMYDHTPIHIVRQTCQPEQALEVFAVYRTLPLDINPYDAAFVLDDKVHFRLPVGPVMHRMPFVDGMA